MNAPLPKPATRPLQRGGRTIAQLRAQGFCLMRQTLPGAIVEALDQDIAERFLDTPFCEGGFYGTRTKRFGRLLIRAAHARILAQHPAIVAIARELLEPHCDTVQLNVCQAIEVHPGEIAQVPHRDQDMWHGLKGAHEYVLNVMWPLTPFRAGNGATRIWPGSHGEAALDPPPSEPGMPIESEPGDALLFLGSTLHGAGANMTSMPRRAIVTGYSLGWLKPYENPWLAYPPEVARHFPPDLAALAGYSQHRPNLGNVDGQCPSRLLEPNIADHVAAIDALTAEQEAMVAAHVTRERGGPQ